VTYEPEFRDTLARSGFRIVEMAPLGDGTRRAAVLAAATPRIDGRYIGPW
jgi:hypothetical protein